MFGSPDEAVELARRAAARPAVGRRVCAPPGAPRTLAEHTFDAPRPGPGGAVDGLTHPARPRGLAPLAGRAASRRTAAPNG